MAKGGEHGPEHHRAHRLVNAWEISKLIRQSATLGRYVIAVRSRLVERAALRVYGSR